eukprot:Sspe_Gene.101270::Locus_75872_Transcript_2_2_Confidence_0.750_Length_787::g.101270::m.101270/K01279/TPP1, CLN2; tripeptidyl-peptidase I
MVGRAVLLLILGAVLGSGRRVFQLQGHPGDWEPRGLASPQHPMHLRFALRQKNLQWLESTFWSVSDPDSPQYGKFPTAEAIVDKLSPTDTELAPLYGWFEKSKVPRSEWHRINGDSITFNGTVRSVLNLFPHLSLVVHVHKHTQQLVVAAQGEAHLPDEVAPLVDMVTGLAFFPVATRHRPNRKAARPEGVDGGAVGPQSLYRLYDIDESLFPLSGTTQAVVEFLNSGSYMPYYLFGR